MRQNEERAIPYLLKVALLISIGPILASVVAGSPAAGLMSLPGFSIVLVIESLRKLAGWPSGEGSFRWVGVVLVIPITFTVPTALSMRLDPSVPQAAMVAMVFLLPLLTTVGYVALAGLDQWARAWSVGGRWVSLVFVGLLVGGGLPAWVFVQGEVQEARVQEARTAFLGEAETLKEHWTLRMRVLDVASDGSEALVLTRDSVLSIGSDGNRRRAVHLERQKLSYLDAAQLDSDPSAEMVVHGEGFNDTLRAFDHDGSPLWSYATPQGTLGSVAAIDLDGNGRSEIAAGSMTGGGLRLLSPSGRKLWADTTLWISDVRALTRSMHSASEAASEGESAPMLYAATGEAIRGYRGEENPVQSLASVDTLRPDAPRPGFVLGVPSGLDSDSTVAGTAGPLPMLVAGAPGPRLVGLTLRGGRQAPSSERWRRRLPSSEAKLAARENYLAGVGDTEGRIFVFDVRTGEPVAASSAERPYRGVEWVDSSDGSNASPVLLGWTRDTVTRLRLPMLEN